jgi:hypothetical protein
MGIQKPSIGRIVHFVQNGVHYAAIVTKVWSDTTVNLHVFGNMSDTITPGATDSQGNASSVTFSQPLDCCGKVNEWSWHWPEVVA